MRRQRAVILDPGCYDKRKSTSGRLVEAWSVQTFVLTHAHIDHVLGNQWVDTYG